MMAGIGWPELVVAVPFLGAMLLAVLRTTRAAWVNLAIAASTCLLALHLPFAPDDQAWLLLDQGGVAVAMLAAFIGVVAAWPDCAMPPPSQVPGRWHAARAQLLQGFVLLGALADSPAVAWAAMGAATCTAVAGSLVTTAPGTPPSRVMPGRVIPGGATAAGLALALLGTAGLTMAAQPVFGLADASWSGLLEAAPRCRGTVLTLAFAALLAGYGTLVVGMPASVPRGMPGGVPGGIPSSIPAVALILLLRAASILSANTAVQGGAVDPGPLLVLFGSAAGLVGLPMLWRAAGIPALLVAAAACQGGFTAIAFGLGSAAATQAGLLQLAACTLARIAVLQCAAADTVHRGKHGPAAAVLALAALAGLPPAGVFTAPMLLLPAAMQHGPLLACGIGGGLVLYAAPCLARAAQAAQAGHTGTGRNTGGGWHLAGVWLTLAVLVILGLVPAVLGLN